MLPVPIVDWQGQQPTTPPTHACILNILFNTQFVRHIIHCGDLLHFNATEFCGFDDVCTDTKVASKIIIYIKYIWNFDISFSKFKVKKRICFFKFYGRNCALEPDGYLFLMAAVFKMICD